MYVGEVMGLYGENTLSKVAIKTLMENSVPKTQSDFRREVDLLSDMRHPNVVCLVGVCLRHDPKCMLFDYMMQGDLHEYLLVHSPHSDIAVGDRTRLIVGVRPKILEYPEMLYISTQVINNLIELNLPAILMQFLSKLDAMTTVFVLAL